MTNQPAQNSVDSLIAVIYDQIEDYGHKRSEYSHDDALPLVLRHAIDALAAERDRADRAEAALAEVWDEAVRSANLVETSARLSIEHDPNPYRTEATA